MTQKEFKRAKDTLENMKTRSAWATGVKLYAADLMRDLYCNDDIEPDNLCNRRLIEKALLNGAESWVEFSESGLAFIYNQDIANRLCNKTELKKTANGTKRPNARETWLDVQARALYQAADLLINILLEVQK